MNCSSKAIHPSQQSTSKPAIIEPAKPAQEVWDNTPIFTLNKSFHQFMKIPQLFGANSKKDDDIDQSIKGEAASYVLYALAKHQLTEENNPTEALALYNRCLIMQREALGKDHVMVARTLHDIGLCLTALDQSFPALTALEEALWIRQQRLGPGDPAVAETTTALWKLLSHERHRIEDDDNNNVSREAHDGAKSTTDSQGDTTTTIGENKKASSKAVYTSATNKSYDPTMATTRQQAATGKFSHSRPKQTKPNSANARSA